MNKRSILVALALLSGVFARGEAASKGETKMEHATFAAGCFWGVEEAFREVKGVKETTVGYTGGTVPNPTYEQVCTHTTGHAEAVDILFDPTEVTYEQLLDVFWKIHDPTQRNRQGPDVGSNYRSAIFYHTPAQQKAAQVALEQLQNFGKMGSRKIATQIVPAGPFYRAEDYHQQYLKKRGLSNCHS